MPIRLPHRLLEQFVVSAGACHFLIILLLLYDLVILGAPLSYLPMDFAALQASLLFGLLLCLLLRKYFIDFVLPLSLQPVFLHDQIFCLFLLDLELGHQGLFDALVLVEVEDCAETLACVQNNQQVLRHELDEAQMVQLFHIDGDLHELFLEQERPAEPLSIQRLVLLLILS